LGGAGGFGLGGEGKGGERKARLGGCGELDGEACVIRAGDVEFSGGNGLTEGGKAVPQVTRKSTETTRASTVAI